MAMDRDRADQSKLSHAGVFVFVFFLLSYRIVLPTQAMGSSLQMRLQTIINNRLGQLVVVKCSTSTDIPKCEGVVHLQRRNAIITITAAAVLPLTIIYSLPQPSIARERRNRKQIPLQDYLTSPDGLKYYDVVEGKGPTAEKGSTVQVHFDCVYRKITAVSSRESKLLAGNRSIAQPYEFKIGATPGKERKRDFADNANGLFSAQAAPKPPPAMYSVTQGMKLGGKRTVIVPPEAGYGNKGLNEIPPGATFELNIELLKVLPPEGK